MKKNTTSINTLKECLSDKEIDYQRISDVTFAVATEKDQNGKQIGNGRNAGNRFESILRYSLVNASHDIDDPEDKSKSDIRFNCYDGYNDIQVKRYQPGFAQVSTIAGTDYYSKLLSSMNGKEKKSVTGKFMSDYFKSFELPPDFLMVQDCHTGDTDYYLFNVEDIARNARSIELTKGSTCDKLRVSDKDGTVFLEVRSGENPQANCLTRGAWVNTDWLKDKPELLITHTVAKDDINVNALLMGY